MCSLAFAAHQARYMQTSIFPINQSISSLIQRKLTKRIKCTAQRRSLSKDHK